MRLSSLFLQISMKALFWVSIVVFFFSSCRETSKDIPQSGTYLTDDLNRFVPLVPLPQRIISLAPSITETLFALGADSAIAGVTDYCDYPPPARSKPKIGGMTNPNVERIVELKPDLVILTVAGNIKTDFERLEALGLRIFVTSPNNVDGVFKSISDLGVLTGRRAAARRLTDSLRSLEDSLIQVARRHHPRSVLLLLSLHPPIAAGSGTFIDELIKLANGRNIAAALSSSYPMLSREGILRERPEVILVSNDVAQSPDEVTHAFPEWKSLPAVSKGNITILNADVIGRPGPRIMEGLSEVVHSLHGREGR